MRILKAVSALLVISGVSACGPSDDYTDLRQYMKEMDERNPGRIEPLPPIETVAPFSYQVADKRSPFEPPVLVTRMPKRDGPQVTPDFNRVKHYLEGFTVAQLSMVGTLAREGTRFALIQDGEGSVTPVTIGDYMGTDHGKISSVEATSVELIEIVPDGTGGWVERARTVNLAEGA